MKFSRWMLVAGTAAIVVAAALAGSLGVSKAPAAAKSQFRAALVSDVAGFNDNGFNANQLKGLKVATKALGGQYFALVSHSSGDYTGNYNTAVVTDKANIVIAAGFLLGGTMKSFAHSHPNTKFAITDDSAVGRGRLQERGRHHVRDAGGRLPRRSPRGQVRAEQGHQGHRRRRRHQDPAGRLVHRGLRVLREEGRARHADRRVVLERLREPGGVRNAGRERDQHPACAGRLPGRRSLR